MIESCLARRSKHGARSGGSTGAQSTEPSYCPFRSKSRAVVNRTDSECLMRLSAHHWCNTAIGLPRAVTDDVSGVIGSSAHERSSRLGYVSVRTLRLAAYMVNIRAKLSTGLF